MYNFWHCCARGRSAHLDLDNMRLISKELEVSMSMKEKAKHILIDRCGFAIHPSENPTLVHP